MRKRSTMIRFALATAVVSAVAFPIGAGSPASAVATKVIDGPDVASYQHPHPTSAHPHGQPINWKAVAAAGKDFAIVKATEGTSYVNPYFAGPYANDYADAAAAGLVHGSYHFARPALPIASSAKDQATLFAHTVGTVTTAATLPPALDLEVTGGLTPGQLVTWAQDFMLDMRAITGRTPMLYTYPYFWEHDLGDPTALARYPMWMANFGTKTAPVSDLWQYTDHAHIKGIEDAVDVSKFMGTSGFPWATLSNGTIATPWVAAAPAAPVSVRATAAGGAVSVSWLPGDSGTTAVTGYRVTATPGGATVNVGGSTFSAIVPGLSTSTAYTFTVTATNSVGTGVASAPTAPVTPSIPTTLAATLRPALRFGTALPLKALLQRADTHAALPGQPVLLFRREAPRNVWVQVRKLSTNSAGLATTVLHPKRSAQLEAVFPGTKGVQRSETFENYLVRPVVTATISAPTVKVGKTVTITGTTTPFVRGQRVVREALVNGHWRVWATSKVGKRGTFTFRITPKQKASILYRIVVGKDKGRAAGYSSTLKLTVD